MADIVTLTTLVRHQPVYAWLVVNVVLSSALAYLMKLISALPLGGGTLYAFFGFVLFLVMLNFVLLVIVKSIFWKCLFGLSIACLCFFSVWFGVIGFVDVVLNLDLVVTHFVEFF